MSKVAWCEDLPRAVGLKVDFGEYWALAVHVRVEESWERHLYPLGSRPFVGLLSERFSQIRFLQSAKAQSGAKIPALQLTARRLIVVSEGTEQEQVALTVYYLLSFKNKILRNL